MQPHDVDVSIKKAANLIRGSDYIVAFTGAGISVESGIPPFRGEGGLWEKYDPGLFDISYFMQNPKKSWKLLKQIFLDLFGKVEPHKAHTVIAQLQKAGKIKAVITQNIDNLHQEAGSDYVLEFHGNSQYLVCMGCGAKSKIDEIDIDELPPRCESCTGILKPDFIFFGEGIPQDAHQASIKEAQKADLFIIVGSTGIVMPAALIPFLAAENGAAIIEINPNRSAYTDQIVDVFIEMKAGEAFDKLERQLNLGN